MTRAAIKHGEGQLRDAVLAGDPELLDALLSEQFVFCGPDGELVGKADALATYRDGRMKLTRYEPSELTIELHGEAAFVTVRIDLAGEAAGAAFAGSFRHTRTWVREEGTWQVLGGHVGAIRSGLDTET